MTGVPPAALAAARTAVPFVNSDACRRILEAAAPAIAEHVAQKILAHMEAHGPKRLPGANADIYNRPRATWRRHFGIAARVAAGAFMTEDDMKRLAAEALARGDFIACYLPEDRP